MTVPKLILLFLGSLGEIGGPVCSTLHRLKGLTTSAFKMIPPLLCPGYIHVRVMSTTRAAVQDSLSLFCHYATYVCPARVPADRTIPCRSHKWPYRASTSAVQSFFVAAATSAPECSNSFVTASWPASPAAITLFAAAKSLAP